jgi:transmembrane sensor
MVQPESSRFIDQQAADWIARRDRGPLSEEDAKALDLWLNGDPRRRGAFLRAQALSLMSESGRALGPQFDPQRFAAPAVHRRPRLSRRRVLTWAGGGAAGAAVAAFGVGVSTAGAITTGMGEVRRVTLDDGSTVMLNTETRVRVRYSRKVRRVELAYGEAYFTVVPDPVRSFVVDVSGAPLHTDRAAFRVRKLSGAPVDILVDQGGLVIEVPRPVLLKANTRLVVAPSALGAAQPQAIAPDLVSRELAWRDGKIAFEGERLDEAAAEFARYSRTRIEIRDPELAGEPVSGLFSASDPVGFSRAVAHAFGAQVDQGRDLVILSRPPKPS